tara:strand:+ start:196 stop:615 length:420 start_codon:yes stop_codon:yes gene_type:complete
MKIQCVSHGLIINESNILVYEVFDKISHKSFFRLIGGHIEFGESASGALIREFKEEINQEIEIVKHIDTFESIFFYNGKDRHEFVSLFNIKFLNKSVYNQRNIIGYEGPDRTFVADWIPIKEFTNKSKIIYPLNILEYL